MTFSDFANFPGMPPKAILGVGDFNSDGRADFVLTLNQLVGYWFSNGAGVAPTIAYMFGEPAFISEVVAADFDGDGLTDVALEEGTNVRVWMSRAFAPPVLASTLQLNSSGATHHLFVTQADGDGLPDLGAISYGGLLGTSGLLSLFALPQGSPQGGILLTPATPP